MNARKEVRVGLAKLLQPTLMDLWLKPAFPFYDLNFSGKSLLVARIGSLSLKANREFRSSDIYLGQEGTGCSITCLFPEKELFLFFYSTRPRNKFCFTNFKMYFCLNHLIHLLLADGVRASVRPGNKAKTSPEAKLKRM